MTGHLPWSIDAVLRLPFLPKQSQSLAEFAYKQVIKRLKDGAIHDDVFYHLVRVLIAHAWICTYCHSECTLYRQNDEAKIDNDPPPLPVLISNAITAIIAGSDTTAASVAQALYLLIGHPQCYKRLQVELDDAFPPGKGMPTDTAKLAKLKYLNAVM